MGCKAAAALLDQTQTVSKFKQTLQTFPDKINTGKSHHHIWHRRILRRRATNIHPLSSPPSLLWAVGHSGLPFLFCPVKPVQTQLAASGLYTFSWGPKGSLCFDPSDLHSPAQDMVPYCPTKTLCSFDQSNGRLSGLQCLLGVEYFSASRIHRRGSHRVCLCKHVAVLVPVGENLSALP